jgi:hypothetical protein
MRAFACAILALTACATAQSRFVPLGPAYPALADDREIEFIGFGEPSRPFVRVSRLDVHFEKTAFIDPTLEEALPELKHQARLSGAEAIIDVHELRSVVGETRVYHVTATGIRFVSQQPRGMEAGVKWRPLRPVDPRAWPCPPPGLAGLPAGGSVAPAARAGEQERHAVSVSTTTRAGALPARNCGTLSARTWAARRSRCTSDSAWRGTTWRGRRHRRSQAGVVVGSTVAYLRQMLYPRRELALEILR